MRAEARHENPRIAIDCSATFVDLADLLGQKGVLPGTLFESGRSFQSQQPLFQQWLSNTVFSMTYDDPEITTPRRRRAGSAAGRIIIHQNFDDPLPDDILEAFKRRGF